MKKNVESTQRRRWVAALEKIISLRWKPNRDLAVVVTSWLLVVGSIYTATHIIGRELWDGMGYFVLYALLGALVFGVGVPLYWTVVVCKRPLSDLGLTTRHWKVSIALQLGLSVLLYIPAFWNAQLPPLEQLIPLIFLALCIGLFEAIFWRGWVQLRFEAAFGILPGIVLAALVYALYHVGYGMPSSEMVFLFFVGLMYAVAFRLTRSILVLYPLFQPLGQLKTLLNDQLTLPLISALGFAEVWIAILGLIWLAHRYSTRPRKEKQAYAHPNPGASH